VGFEPIQSHLMGVIECMLCCWLLSVFGTAEYYSSNFVLISGQVGFANLSLVYRPWSSVPGETVFVADGQFGLKLVFYSRIWRSGAALDPCIGATCSIKPVCSLSRLHVLQGRLLQHPSLGRLSFDFLMMQ